MVDFCLREQIESARVLEALEDDPSRLSFDECERRVRNRLADQGVEFGSNEHRGTIQYRPVEPIVREVLDKVVEQHGNMGISPLELLLILIRADPALAERLAQRGLRADAISAALDRH
jgi:hypothetical protein